MIIGSLASLICTCALTWWQSAWKPKLMYSTVILRKMIGFSVWSLLESMAIWLTGYIGTFMVGLYFADYYVGVYRTSMTTVTGIMSLINSAFASVMFSSLSRLQKDDEAFLREYYRFQRLFGYVLLPLGAGMLLYQSLCVQLLLGSQWGDASFFFGIYSLTMALCVVFAQNLTVVFRSRGNPRLILICQSLYLVFEIALLALGARRGFDGMCVATALAVLAYIAICQVVARIAYKMSVWRLLSQLREPIIATVAMSIVAIAMLVYGRRLPCHHIREYRYAFGAVEPLTGENFFLVMPLCNTNCMTVFLEQLSMHSAGSGGCRCRCPAPLPPPGLAVPVPTPS